jgi:hypothetical protein
MVTKDSATLRESRSLTFPKSISRRAKLAALSLVLFLFYAVGVSVRSSRGILVLVQNESGMSLRDANIILEQGEPYPLGEIAAGKKKKIFIVPDADSRIRVAFTDQNGLRHSEIVAGYVENGYCGDVRVQVLAYLRVSSRDDSFAVWNWKSWYGFL